MRNMLREAIMIERRDRQGGMLKWYSGLSKTEQEAFQEELRLSVKSIEASFYEVGQILQVIVDTVIVPALRKFSEAVCTCIPIGDDVFKTDPNCIIHGNKK
jgi:hypothetical protein